MYTYTYIHTYIHMFTAFDTKRAWQVSRSLLLLSRSLLLLSKKSFCFLAFDTKRAWQARKKKSQKVSVYSLSRLEYQRDFFVNLFYFV